MVSSFFVEREETRGRDETSDSMHVNKNESSLLFAKPFRFIIHFSFIASSTTTKQYIMYLSHAGKVPSDISLLNLLQSIPSPIPGLAHALFPPSLVSIPTPLRQSLTNFVTEPTYNALSTTGIPSLLLQSLDITQQIPKLIDEVEQGARDFVPSPEAMSSAARRAYRCRRTLLLQFNNDNLDDSEILEGYLKEAESVMKMKRPMIAINLERKVLDGNHLTPLLGPSGGEEWGKVLEETLGGVLGSVAGRSNGATTDDSGGIGDDATNENSRTSSSSSSAKAVRERLGYEQVSSFNGFLYAPLLCVSTLIQTLWHSCNSFVIP
jgi:hypothetical protein